MADFTELLNTIKQAANEAVEAGSPVNVCFGKVTSESPLQILVDQKMTLGAAQLVLARNVTQFSTMVTIQWTSEKENENHKHEIKSSQTSPATSGWTENQNVKHTHDIEGTKMMTVHNELHKGDEVIILRVQGGQKYIVLDRIGGG